MAFSWSTLIIIHSVLQNLTFGPHDLLAAQHSLPGCLTFLFFLIFLLHFKINYLPCNFVRGFRYQWSLVHNWWLRRKGSTKTAILQTIYAQIMCPCKYSSKNLHSSKIILTFADVNKIRLYVSTHQGGVESLAVANCDRKNTWRSGNCTFAVAICDRMTVCCRFWISGQIMWKPLFTLATISLFKQTWRNTMSNIVRSISCNCRIRTTTASSSLTMMSICLVRVWRIWVSACVPSRKCRRHQKRYWNCWNKKSSS